MPECKKLLVIDETEMDDPSIIGDEAHIVAREPDGPRGDSDLSPEERDKFDNLILLCKIHHKIIDDQPDTYTVERLHHIKDDHIAWFRKTGEYDEAKQNDDEAYASYIETWSQRCNLNEWDTWSLSILGADSPWMLISTYNQLRELNKYILSRIWSHRYPELESAFINFSLVLNDLLNVFDKHSIEHRNGEILVTEKFYKIHEHEEKRYKELLRKFNYHVNLINDLILELTRAANYMCDQIRKFISQSYRLHEGVLLVTSGPNMEFKYTTSRVEYRIKELSEYPYPGLKDFMTIRASRDTHYGKDYSPDYFPSLKYEG